MTTLKQAAALAVYPFHKQTEFSVISLLLKHPNNIEVALSNNITENSFFETNCRNIFKAVSTLKKKNAFIDLNTTVDQLHALQIHIEYENIRKLLSTYVDHSDKLTELCLLLKDYEQQRELIAITKEVEAIAYSDKMINDKLENISSSLSKINKVEEDKNTHNAASSYNSVLEIIKEKIKSKGKNTSSWMHFDLDTTLGGIQTGLHIIGARPGVGKTSFIDEVIDYNSKFGKRILFFSAEMNYEELIYRKIQRELGIDANRLRKGEIFEHELLEIEQFDKRLNDNVIINDSSNLEILKLRITAKLLNNKEKLDMIVVDYLQLLKASYKKTRYEEVSEISMQLKALSKELKIPVIALAQLNRNNVKANEKPNLSDLRESGQIEQDADSVSFIHRPAMYDKTSPYKRPDCEIVDFIIAKNRFGRTESRYLKFIGKNVKFTDMTHDDEIPEFEGDKQEEKKSFKFK